MSTEEYDLNALEGAPRQLPIRHLTHYPLLWQSEQAYVKENIALVLVIRLGYIKPLS